MSEDKSAFPVKSLSIWPRLDPLYGPCFLLRLRFEDDKPFAAALSEAQARFLMEKLGVLLGPPGLRRDQ